MQGYYQTLEFDDGSGVDTINTDQYGIGAQYRFGAFRIALNHGVADEELPAGGSIEHEAIDIGLGAKLGHGEVLFNYVRQEFDSPRFGVGGGVADTEPQTFAVGIRQRF